MPINAAAPSSPISPGPVKLGKAARSKELDGLRGIAALTVVFCHFFDLFPADRWTAVWKVSPLYALIAGREAVVVFFVLSGFALHRMYLKTRDAGYAGFALRRILRIYAPYLGALAMAATADYFLSTGYRSHFNPWFNQTWIVPFHWRDVWRHVAFLGVYNNLIFDTAFWSLIQEMRISLVFPLLFLFIAAKAASRQIGFALLLVISGTLATATFAKSTDLGDSVHFAGLFIFGIFISERKTSLAEWYRSLPSAWHSALTIFAALLFYYGRIVAHAVPTAYASILDIPVGIGASGIIVLAFSSRRFSAFLDSRPVAWLGDVSYSLYLVHGTILFGLVNLLNLAAPRCWLLALYVPLALLAAAAFHACVEKPLLYQSRKVTARANTKRS